MFKQYARIQLTENERNWLREYGGDNPLLEDEIFIYLGEIPNMLGHAVVAGYSTGRVISGFHIENFELFDDEDGDGLL